MSKKKEKGESVKIDKNILAKVRKLAKKEDRTITSVLRKAINAYLDAKGYY